MHKSQLVPFLRENLKILFIGLNPAEGSSKNRHYFSVNKAFWNQLFKSGLITDEIDKSEADSAVFGSTVINRNNWNYGITDLVTDIAESNSAIIKPSYYHCERLINDISRYKPETAIILHSKVLKIFLNYLDKPLPESNSGISGKIINGSDTMFFNIAFPHGNAISADEKVKRYIEVIEYLERRNKETAEV